MEPQNTTPIGVVPPSSPTAAPHEKKSIGPLVGTLIVLLVLILGGLYLWGSKLEQDNMNNTPPFILGDDNADAGLPPTSNSDAVVDIEADIAATDMNTFESEVNADVQAAAGSL